MCCSHLYVSQLTNLHIERSGQGGKGLSLSQNVKQTSRGLSLGALCFKDSRASYASSQFVMVSWSGLRGFRLTSRLILASERSNVRREIWSSSSRWLSSAAKPAGETFNPELLNVKDKQTMHHLKRMSNKSWMEWAKERSDEIQVVVLWGFVLITTLQNVRMKGEHREEEKEWEEEKAELEAELEKLKSETRASVREGASKIATDFGIKNANKVEDLRGAILALVEKGITKAASAKKVGKNAAQDAQVEEELSNANSNTSPQAGSAEPPRKIGGLI